MNHEIDVYNKANKIDIYVNIMKNFLYTKTLLILKVYIYIS
jgi:hypothetical protein